MSAPRFTVSAGRVILRDGQPFLSINREGATTPVEADAWTHFIAQLLNLSEAMP